LIPLPPISPLFPYTTLFRSFAQHGFVFWNNLWYAGRYSFITYSPLYYPIASVVGIRVLAVVSLSAATAAYAAIVEREWGYGARRSEEHTSELQSRGHLVCRL